MNGSAPTDGSATAGVSIFTLGRDFTGAALLASYTNGRLLSATDLSTDQQTLTNRDRWIGRAAGAGVIDGLTVTASATTVTVAPGLGLTGAGEPVVLNQTTSLPLAVPLEQATTSTPGKFSCCSTPTQGSTGLVAAGSYVLTVRAASQTQGNAGTAPPPGAVGSGGCVAAWAAAGVEFRVTALPVATTIAGITMTADNRRNLVATWCYGPEELVATAAEPFDDPGPYGLALTGVAADDLPLAVLAWDGQSIADLDLWSVRRRITSGALGSDAWGLLTSDLRISEGQARFRQFQDQVAELVRKQVAEQVVAADTFPVLPPVGFLPVAAADQKAFAQAAAERLGRLDQLDGVDDAPQEVKPPDGDPGGAVGGREAIGSPEGRAAERVAVGPLELLLMVRAFAAASGSGFVRETFFGRTARFGGIIDFELAECLLRESWYRPPVVLPPNASDDSGKDEAAADDGGWSLLRSPLEARPPGSAGGPQQPDLPRIVPNQPITFYLIRENLVALAGKGASKRQRLLNRQLGLASVGSAYVVFVSNYHWYGDSTPPIATIRAQAQSLR